MSMDTNKIREAAGKIWLNATSHGTEEPYATLSKIILAELDKVQQPGKVLTDEKCREIEQAWQQAHGADITHTMAFSDGLATARDYLAPAAGLTVEDVMDIADEVFWVGDEVDLNGRHYTGMANLHARLTAAIEAKTNNK